MIITGPHGIDDDKPSSPLEAVWAQVEVGQGNAAIPRGSLCQWDNINPLNINTRGLRVVICPTAASTDGTTAQAGFAYKAMPARSGDRGEVGLLLVYGYMSGVPINNAGCDNALPLAPIMPSGTVAGAVRTHVNNAAPTASDVSKIAGFTFTGFGAGVVTGTTEIFAKCM